MAKLEANGTELLRMSKEQADNASKATIIISYRSNGWILQKTTFIHFDGSKNYGHWVRRARIKSGVTVDQVRDLYTRRGYKDGALAKVS